MLAHEHFDRNEELANAITHGLALLASVVAGAGLISFAAMAGDVWRIASAAVYSVALLLLYAASTAYHAARQGKAKALLEIFDHCAIYLLIAGTYTPFTLVALRGPWGWSLFGVIWGLALAGIVFKIAFIGRFNLLSTLIYIAMGWLVVVAAVPMFQALSTPALIWLVAGGVLYTAGTYFYQRRRFPFSHAVWHLFVIGGSVCHFLAVSTQIVPA
jgi:hemolysin III